MSLNRSNYIYWILLLLFLNPVLSNIEPIFSAIAFDLLSIFIFSVFNLSFLFWFVTGLLYDIVYGLYFGINSIFYITLHCIIYFTSNIFVAHDSNIFKGKYIPYMMLIFNIVYFFVYIYRYSMVNILSHNFVDININLYPVCIIINNILLYLFFRMADFSDINTMKI